MQANGLYCMEAAVELLIRHEDWLHDENFVCHYMQIDAGSTSDGFNVSVDWRGAMKALDAEDLNCAPSQANVLRIAASLAEGVPIDLGDALSNLNTIDLPLVVGTVTSTRNRPLTEVTK